MKSVLLFISESFGELVLRELEDINIYPFIVTNTHGSMRRRLVGDISNFRDNFRIITTNSEPIVDMSTFPSTDYILTVDWVKDYFHKLKDLTKIFHAHPSLLPLYRGYGAISEQFFRGVVNSGITIYNDNGKVDSGDIIYQKEIKIDYLDTPIAFIDKYAKEIAIFIKKMVNGDKFYRYSQDESKAFYLTRVRNKQLVIDFNMSAISVHNFIRAYSYPFNGAIFYFNGVKYKAILAIVEKWHGTYGFPGVVIGKDDYGIEVACGEGSIIISEIYKDNFINATLCNINIGDRIF